MNSIQSLVNAALVNGENAKIIPIHRLQSLKSEIHRFEQIESLNTFQKWIVNNLYEFEVPDIVSVGDIILYYNQKNEPDKAGYF